MIHIVAYDLHNPTRDYTKVEAVIKTASGGWAHLEESVWLVDTMESVSTWRDKLQKAGDSNDTFFVSRLAPRDWASSNVKAEVTDWLKHSGRRW